jgi:hypothetical protein
MITSDDAHRVATGHRPGHGRGWPGLAARRVRRPMVRPRGLSQESVRGGSSCVVERTAGRVLFFPTSIWPTRIKSVYDQVVDRASQVQP